MTLLLAVYRFRPASGEIGQVDSNSDELFRRIFHEAHIVDLDFWKWDKFVRLVVVGRVCPVDSQKRFPLYNVDFLDVSAIEWKSNHVGIELDSPDRHCQWTVIEFELRREKGCYEVFLSGVGGPSPELRIRCRDIRIANLDITKVDAVNPAWNRPYGPLARPSLDELYDRGRSAGQKN